MGIEPKYALCICCLIPINLLYLVKYTCIRYQSKIRQNKSKMGIHIKDLQRIQYVVYYWYISSYRRGYVLLLVAYTEGVTGSSPISLVSTTRDRISTYSRDLHKMKRYKKP
jgi:hypothetical protein